nr:protein FAR1-RELATED SEQUENCE 5-like [Ipomoea batatas]
MAVNGGDVPVWDEECALLIGKHFGSSWVRSEGDELETSMELAESEPYFWTPNVDVALRPAVGLRFSTLSEVCSRQGVKGGVSRPPPGVNGDDGGKAKQRRSQISNWVRCLAKIFLRRDNTGEFVVSIFEEKHTHPLCSESSRQFMRINRSLDSTQQAFIASCLKANIGTSQSFRLCKELMGTYGNIGATSVDFHNFKRDLQSYVGRDEENRLALLFCADPVARANFLRFGDVISFDATYGTNRCQACMHTCIQFNSPTLMLLLLAW